MDATTDRSSGLEEIARCTDCPDPAELARADADLRVAMARVRRRDGAAVWIFDLVRRGGPVLLYFR